MTPQQGAILLLFFWIKNLLTDQLLSFSIFQIFTGETFTNSFAVFDERAKNNDHFLTY